MDVSRETMWLGLGDVAEKPDASILLVDESSYPDALGLFKSMAVLSWQGEPRGLSVDPLRGRRVVLWPSYPSIWSQHQLKEIAEAAYGSATSLEWVQAHGEADPRRTPAAFAGLPHEAAAWAKSRLVTFTPQPAEPPADPSDPDAGYYIDNPKPLDVFRRSVVPGLKREHLPAQLAAYVFDQSEIVGSDPGILAISCLVAAAAVANDAIKLQPRLRDPTWTESARLWGAFVGDPSVKKTPAVRRAISHVKKMDMDLGGESASDMAAYQTASKVYKKHEAAYIKGHANGAAGTQPERPEKPPVRRIIVEDTTLEALGMILADNPRGVLVLHDELAGFFGSMDAYRSSATGKDRAAWLEAYNGGPKRIDRVTREPLFVRNWSACVLGGIQPSAIRKIANELTEDGLLQRFMVVMASEQGGNGDDRAPDLAVLQAYRDMLDQLYAIEPPDSPIKLCPEGVAIREQFDTDMREARSLEWLPIRMRYALGKWDGLFARLTLTFHLIECAYARKHPAGHVHVDTVQRVNRFLREYLFHHLSAFYGDVLEQSNLLEHVRWIAGYIVSRRLTAINVREISRAYGRWNSMLPWQQTGTLRLLEDAAWLFPDTSNPGKRVTNWMVNFRVNEEFGEQGAREEARRQEIRRRLADLSLPARDA